MDGCIKFSGNLGIATCGQFGVIIIVIVLKGI